MTGHKDLSPVPELMTRPSTATNLHCCARSAIAALGQDSNLWTVRMGPVARPDHALGVTAGANSSRVSAILPNTSPASIFWWA